MQERDRINTNYLLDKEVDYSRLRDLGQHFEEIDSDSTDAELWKSVLKIFNDLIERSN